MLQILGKPTSINVRKVLWTCAEIGISYVHDPAPDPATLARLNPNGMVPVVTDGADTLWESNTICRYLAGAHGRTDLLPAAPMARAQVEKWMDWQATEFNNSWRYAFMALVRNSPAHTDAAAIAAGVAGWNRHAAMADAALAGGSPYLCGDVFTLADVVVGLSLQRWHAAPLAHTPLPAVEAYLERLCERAGFRAHGRNGMP
jgi:glutathione S-transferase